MIIVITRSGTVLNLEEGAGWHRQGDAVVCTNSAGQRLTAFASSDLRAMTVINDGGRPKWELFQPPGLKPQTGPAPKPVKPFRPKLLPASTASRKVVFPRFSRTRQDTPAS